MPLYIIHHSEYGFRGERAYFSELNGTYRQLLEHLNNITDENRNQLWFEDEPEMGTFGSQTDEQLIQLFIDGNGDGQPFVMVYDATNHKTVFGDE